MTRIRRQPEEASREILDAARRLLAERSVLDLRVDDVMAATTLSRPSFYVYFKDRTALLLGLVEEVSEELFAVTRAWMEGQDDPREDAREVVLGLARVYARHGPVLRALSEAAAHEGPVADVYRGVVERFVDAAAGRVERAGVPGGEDLRETTRALVWMTERYLTERLGRAPQARPDEVAATVLHIWLRVLEP